MAKYDYFQQNGQNRDYFSLEHIKGKEKAKQIFKARTLKDPRASTEGEAEK